LRDLRYTCSEMTSHKLWSRHDRHFVGITYDIRVLPTRCRRIPADIDMERNCVTVILCIFLKSSPANTSLRSFEGLEVGGRNVAPFYSVQNSIVPI